MQIAVAMQYYDSVDYIGSVLTVIIFMTSVWEKRGSTFTMCLLIPFQTVASE